MMERIVKAGLVAVLAVVFATAFAPGLRAEDEPAVSRGVQYLRGRIGSVGVGETGLSVLALLKAGVPATDPSVVAGVAKLRKRFTSTAYQPERSGGPDIYEAAVVGMVLANLDLDSRRAELNLIAQFLTGRQNPNGSWDYVGRTQGDTSISQYAVLGLWEADHGGANVPRTVWDRAARWYLSVQGAAGSWNYHRDDPGSPETISMTAAGVSSLLICRRQLTRSTTSDAPSPLLQRLTVEDARADGRPQVSAARLDQAIRRGLGWLGAHFTTRGTRAAIGPSIYYGLYGIERIGALADREMLGRTNWYDEGGSFIRSSQRADGAWSSSFGDEVNTAWAILFLTRSTVQSLRRFEATQLGAGTLVGGRGLPQDLSSLTVAGGRIVSRPMSGAVEGMLSILEDPRTEHADEALAGLVARYRTEGPDVLRPHKDRFRKLLSDRDPGLRRVAAWALGHTGDLDAVPALIGVLTDPDEGVVGTARLGLQLISRKIEGLGPPSPSTPEQRREAAQRWRDWYKSVRPLDLDGRGVEATGAGVLR